MSLTETDAEGRYVLENLPAANYLVAVGPVGALYYYPGVITQSDAKVVAVNGNSTVGGIDFASNGTSVRGRIIPSPSQIEFEIPEISLLSNGVTIQKRELGPDHSFSFLDVPPGRYTVMLTGGAERDLLVPDTDLANLELVMPSVVQFKVRLRVENGDPPPQTIVSFRGARAYSTPGVTNTRGEVGMLLPVGEYAVSFPAELKGYTLKSIEIDGASYSPSNVKLTEEHARRHENADLTTVVLILATGSQ